MPINLEKIAKIHEADREVIRKKNAAYGNNNIRLTGVGGVLTRILDKASRAVNIAQNPDLDQFGEVIEDTLGDLSNYGVLGRMLLNGDLYERPNSVYLAGPVDMIENVNGPEYVWREVAKEALNTFGIATFDPMAAWSNGTVNDTVKQQVMGVDFNVVRTCDMMLAYLPSHIPTLGTIREIERARSLDKRVVVISNWAGGSAFSVDLEVYTTLEEALTAITQVMILEEPDEERTTDSESGSYFIGGQRVQLSENKPAR